MIGLVNWFCYEGGAQALHTCTISDYVIGRYHATALKTVTHELAHVYTMGPSFMREPTEFRGMVWPYFVELGRNAEGDDDGGYDCNPRELMAEAITDASRPGRQFYFGQCRNTPHVPSEATRAVVASMLAHEIPGWFIDTYGVEGLPYDTSALDGYGEMFDLEQLWADFEKLESWNRAVAVWSLRDAFGGYCDREQAHQSAFHGGVTRNPWAAGGCVSQAPPLTVTPADTGLALSWEAPAYDGGSPITGYVVEWKPAGEEFGGDAQPAHTTAADVTTHTVTGLTDGTQYTVRVQATNVNGNGALVHARA